MTLGMKFGLFIYEELSHLYIQQLHLNKDLNIIPKSVAGWTYKSSLDFLRDGGGRRGTGQGWGWSWDMMLRGKGWWWGQL